MKEERSVKGQQLIRLKTQPFEAIWKKLANGPGVYTHDGTRVAESGHLIDQDWKGREAFMKQLE